MSRITEERARENDLNIMRIMKDGIRRSPQQISELLSDNGTPMTYPGVDKVCRTRLVSKGLLTMSEMKAGKRTSRTYKAIKVYNENDKPVKAPETPVEAPKAKDYGDIPSLEFKPSRPAVEPKKETPVEKPKQGITFNEAIVKIYAGEKVSLISTGNIYSLTGMGIKDDKGIIHCTFSKMEMEGLWEVMDLIPCPFCKGEGKVVDVKCKGVDCKTIQCKDCEAVIKPARTLRDAKERWNRRAQ